MWRRTLVAALATLALSCGVSAQDKAETVAQVEAYLNGIETLRARFVQIGPNGELSRGRLYLRRPGRLRFEYEPPSPLLIVADRFWLILYDKELEQVSRFPLYETPLGVLVRETIDLDDKVRVTEVRREPGALHLSLVDADEPDAGSISLVFTSPALSLRQWSVLDPQGGTTHVSLRDLEINVPLAPELFTFTDPKPFEE